MYTILGILGCHNLLSIYMVGFNEGQKNLRSAAEKKIKESMSDRSLQDKLINIEFFLKIVR